MRWLMLCREPRLYSCKRLKQAANLQGITLDILDPNRFVLRLEKGRFQFGYHYGEMYEKPRREAELLPDYQAIIPRFGPSSTAMGCRVLQHYQQQGISTLNSAEGFQTARDKWLSLQKLAACGLPIPSSTFCGPLAHTCPIGSSVIKTLSGSQGIGVMLCENPSTAVSLMDTLREGNIQALVQDFLSDAAGEDVRAFVIGNQVVAAMRRKSKAGDFRANIHQGGSAESIFLSPSAQQLAIHSAKAIGLEVAGVDLIPTSQGLVVLEVNASPGLEMIEQISKAPIAELMIAHLLEKVRARGLR